MSEINMTEFNEMIGSLNSVEQDLIINSLNDVFCPYGVLESKQEYLHYVVDKIDAVNEKREKLSRRCSSMQTCFELLQKHKGKNLYIDCFLFVILYTIEELKTKIEELKPNDLLQKKNAVKKEIAFLEIKNRIVKTFQEGIKDGSREE